MTTSLDQITVEQYVAILRDIKLTPKQHAMLKAHYQFPQQTATVRQLCVAVGGYVPNTFNALYGSLAKKIAYAIDESPQYYLVNYFCRFPQEKPELVVKLRPNFVAALERLRLVP